MGEHDFLDYMFFRMTCLLIAYVLREVMLCCRKCHRMSCIGGVYVLYNILCFTERHALLEVMFYLRVCIIGGHVLLFEMSYWKACPT